MGREQASVLERGIDDGVVNPTHSVGVTADVEALLSDAQALLGTDAAMACKYLTRALAMLRASAIGDGAPRAPQTSQTPRGPRTPQGPQTPQTPPTPDRSRGLAPWQLKRLTTHIDTHLGARLRTADLAAIAGLSVSHFCHAFKTTVGVPPAAYVGRRRIDAARAMMETTDESLTRIAHLHGFCDQSHFTRTFRRELGMAPQAWRRWKGARQSA